MKRLVLTLTGLTLLLFSINAQENKNRKAPDEEIIVNREYDEDGNLIGYDSTYIHRWSSDSTFSFDIPDDFFAGDPFPDMERLMDGFFSDSVLQQFDLPPGFGFSPFEDKDFLKHYEYAFPDSAFMKRFGFDAGRYSFDHDAIFRNMEEFQKQMREHFGNFDFAPPSSNWPLNEDQKRELEELKERHRKEIGELHRKWEEEKRE